MEKTGVTGWENSRVRVCDNISVQDTIQSEVCKCGLSLVTVFLTQREGCRKKDGDTFMENKVIIYIYNNVRKRNKNKVRKFRTFSH